METDIQTFDTREAILALCLTLAGCEPLDESQPCFNLYDAEILAKHGYRGKPLIEAAQEAWEQKEKGDVGYVFKMTPRLVELAKLYRETCQEIEKADGKAFVMLADIIGKFAAHCLDPDEAILKFSCVVLKTRGQYFNVWKEMVPLLRVPVDGRAKHFDGTVSSNGRTIESKNVHRPGFKVISLNASPGTKEHLKL